ncbi:hypothetical protein [Gluconacetobacter tumulisoli]|uniref:Pentapeptide MXKDX repeat protein n=1 Tax=Gluconacetobacter tumulisoli TaxID=1286189 RepID=A0A7W4PLQ3_9PROT|nr:hypothetical protein [Gluconacetobacter tumulisoli]MBB2200874.1 hypothetical protein [Gluconacetobacter tumulisoli]
MFAMMVKRVLFTALLLTASAAHAGTQNDPDMSGMQGMAGMEGMSGMNHDRTQRDAKTKSTPSSGMNGMTMEGKTGNCMKMKGMDMSKTGCDGNGDGMKMPMGPQGMPDAVHER